MTEANESQNLARAWAFFKRAKQAGETGNFDYAIDMYLEGLRCAPDELKGGHLPLRELALRRLAHQAKKPSVMERVKFLRGKNPTEQMLNAEYLMAKDPENLHYIQIMLKAAIAGGFAQTTGWLADLLFAANRTATRPSFAAYVLLKDAYGSISQFEKAIAACQLAVQMKPEDGDLADEFKRLNAELTLSRGKYDQEGDFRQSIRDAEAQQKLHAQEGVVKSDFFRASLVDSARQQLAKDPDSVRNNLELADALADLETDQGDNEAIELLEGAYKRSRDFALKQKAGQIKINHARRALRKARAALEQKPDDAQAQQQVDELTRQVSQTELEHWRLCVENHPTDLAAKYEYGVRLSQAKEYDQAIPLLQQAQRDPRHKISAMGKIGVCFFEKGWLNDAIDIFGRAVKTHPIKDDAIGKDLRYNLGRCYEKQGNIDKALEIYRKIAQIDFGYRDVSQRVDKLRSDAKDHG